jgi:hypothetical protein
MWGKTPSRDRQRGVPICADGRSGRAPTRINGSLPILTSAMAFIGGSIVTIALPVLQAGLGASLKSLQWITWPATRLSR